MQKKKRNTCITSKDIDDQIILQSDWMRAFSPITCEPEFPQIWGLCKKTENCDALPFRLLPAKSKKNQLHFGSLMGSFCPF